jgi:hypothetical protein
MLCAPELAILRGLVEEIQRWPDVVAEPYYDRGTSPTGVRLRRGDRRFANIFPSASLQFAHGGTPLQGLDARSEDSDHQSIPVGELALRMDEARVLAAYAYWKAGQ